MVFFYHHYELPAILRQAHQSHYPTTRLTTRPSRANSVPQEAPAPTAPPPAASTDPAPTININLGNDPPNLGTLNERIASNVPTLGQDANNLMRASSSSTHVITPPPVISQNSAVASPTPNSSSGCGGGSEEMVSSLLQESSSVGPTIFNPAGHTPPNPINVNSYQNHNQGESPTVRSHDADATSKSIRDGDGGVNNNDCNPSRKSPSFPRNDDLTSDTVLTSSSPPCTSNPAQVTGSGCSNTSQNDVNTTSTPSSSLSLTQTQPNDNDYDGLRRRLPSTSGRIEIETGKLPNANHKF